MQTLIIKPTSSTPGIVLDKSENLFKIFGRSLPEDAFEFYEPVLDWFKLYCKNPNISTNLVFELEYFNSASVKVFVSILYSLNKLIDGSLNVHVEWRYTKGDDDTVETGEDFASLVNIPFSFVVVAI